MDETGFSIGVGRTKEVITRSSNRRKRLFTPDPQNREHSTLIEAVSAGGETMPPMIILTGATITETSIVESLPGDYLLTAIETGYSNDEVLFEWIHHFNRFTKDKAKGRYRMLISDGYKSHIEYDFIEYY